MYAGFIGLQQVRKAPRGQFPRAMATPQYGMFTWVSDRQVQVAPPPCLHKACSSLCREWTLSWLQEAQAALSVAVIPGGE